MGFKPQEYQEYHLLLKVFANNVLVLLDCARKKPLQSDGDPLESCGNCFNLRTSLESEGELLDSQLDFEGNHKGIA